MASVRIGDVLEDCNGTQRVVREVTRYKDGDLCSVTFVIRSCSWTGRPYTILNYTDLRYRGFKPTGFRKRLGSVFDWKLYSEIKSKRPWPQRNLGCCDVRGVA
jgi:hypothetical protein